MRTCSAGGGPVRYLGTWRGALLLRRGSAWFQQSDDGALGPKWREFRITKKIAEAVMRLERVEGDMVFGLNDANIPPVVAPLLEDDPGGISLLAPRQRSISLVRTSGRSVAGNRDGNPDRWTPVLKGRRRRCEDA